MNFTDFSNILNGKPVKTSLTRHSINPSNLEPNAEVPLSTAKEVDLAVEFAKTAAGSWRGVPLAERQQKVIDFANGIRAHHEDFSVLLTKEQGKPLAVARDEIDRAARWLEIQARLPFSEHIVEETDDSIVKTRYIPLGVAATIVPWNYPVMLACGKLAPALVTGNAVILKPSPFTPYCGLKLAELAQQFFPPGVVQALSGDDSLGPLLTAHEGIDKISFTGSTATGKLVMQGCAKTMKRVTLELGGNDPAIVCSNVDVKDTAAKIANLAFLNSGQICVAIKRVYIHHSIYQEFLAAVVETTKGLLVGDGMADNVALGPIQNSMQYERVQEFINEAQKTSQVAYGQCPGTQQPGKGYFVTPTIVDRPADDSRIATEEPFGPVLPLFEWKTEEEVISRANDSKMGLGASVWSQDTEEANRIAHKLEAGSVWVNSHLQLRPDATFGGVKESGIGTEWGIDGLKSYCNAQTLFLQKPKAKV